MRIPARSTGQDDDLAPLTRSPYGGAHSRETVGIAPPQRVVDYHRGAAAVGTYYHSASQSTQEPQLFTGAGAQLINLQGDPVQGAADHL